MEFVKTVAETFGISLLATLAVAGIARLGGAKPNWRLMVAIAVGLALSKIIQLQFSISTGIYPFVVGASIAVCALLIRPWRQTAGRDA